MNRYKQHTRKQCRDDNWVLQFGSLFIAFFFLVAVIVDLFRKLLLTPLAHAAKSYTDSASVAVESFYNIAN
jgi:hypothetical protein